MDAPMKNVSFAADLIADFDQALSGARQASAGDTLQSAQRK